jgi:hypothetical protein
MMRMASAYFLTPYLTHDLYLLSQLTHITPKKIIAGVVVAVVVVIALVVWFVRRRQSRA